MYPKSIYGKTKLLGEKLIIKNLNNSKINYAILRYLMLLVRAIVEKLDKLSKGDQLFKNLSIAFKNCESKNYSIWIKL